MNRDPIFENGPTRVDALVRGKNRDVERTNELDSRHQYIPNQREGGK